MERFDYSSYLLGVQGSQIEYEARKQAQKHLVKYFRGCRKVLDIACGLGSFLELLQEEGNIDCVGVDMDPKVVEYAQGKGLQVINGEAIEFLRNCSEVFDGIYCSHFIEHLPFEEVVDLIEAVSRRMEKGGIFVLVFPNPESLNAQLFSFWKDPQHVRFYHGELIRAMLIHYGFAIQDYIGDHTTLAMKKRSEVTDNVREEKRGLLSQAIRRVGLLRKLWSLVREKLRLRLGIIYLENCIEEMGKYLDGLRNQTDEVVIVARKIVG
jgi:2-polyprenyl-3-methyl-5-hydroxy-6-metoxy-1,4-benzoquinol methylase